MKLNISNAGSEVIASNSTVEEVAFTIANNPIAFKILSDNLYTNKIGSIVRELSCNAYDSQVTNGNPDKPFDIFVPSHTEKRFIIRDYGTGLTKEQVEGIYTSLFNSTKNDTNDLIGGLGLGSKTPFSYTDSFTVTSYKDGIATIYGMRRNENYELTYTTDGSFETDEPNGLEIEIPVEEKDIDNFVYEIKEFFKYNDLRPNFKNINIQIPTLELKYKIKELSAYFAPYKSDRSIRIRLSKVAYPLNVDRDLRLSEFYSKCEEYCESHKDISEYSLRNFINDLYYGNTYNNLLIIDFPIGDLEVTASRESLSLDDKSKSKLVNKLFDIAVGVYAKAQKDKKNIKTVMDFIKYQQAYAGISKLGSIDTTLETYVKVQDNYATISREFLKELNVDLKKPLAYTFFEKNKNDRYKRSDSIPYAKKVNERNYLYKLYIGSSMITAVNTWMDDTKPENCMYIKVHKDDMDTLKNNLKLMPKGVFSIDYLEVNPNPAKRISVPLYDSIEVCGRKVVAEGTDPETGETQYDIRGFYGVGKTELEKSKEKPLYYIECDKDGLEDWKTKSLITALADKGITKVIYGLRPRQIQTLQKVGYKLILAPEALGYDFIAKNNKLYEIYRNTNNLQYTIRDILRYGLFSDTLRQELEKFKSKFEKKYKKQYIYYGKSSSYISNKISDHMEVRFFQKINDQIIKDFKSDPDFIKSLHIEAISFAFDEYHGSDLLHYLRNNTTKFSKVVGFLKKELDSFVKI